MTTITAEDSRELLERFGKAGHASAWMDHLRAALDREEAERTRVKTAEEERDALLHAAGFRAGHFRDALSRKVILGEVAGRMPAMVQARRERDKAEQDASLWQLSCEVGDRPPLLVKVWKRAKKAEAERDAARVEAVAEAVAVIETLGTEWPHGWVPSHEAMLRLHALAQEPI